MTLAGALALPPVVAQAAHVGCGTVITTDTTLDSDLLDCPASGLYIGAPGVSLDLGGHVVDGRHFGSVGVQNLSGHDNVTIRNGIVQEFATGVWLQGTTGNLLSDLELRNNDNWGANLIGAHGNVLRALFAHDNTYDGIRLGEGISSDANDNRIEDSRVESNRESGIRANNSERNVFYRNVATGNGEYGIRLDDCCLDADGNAVVENRLWDNGTTAFADIRLLYEDGASIEGNSATGGADLTNSPRAALTHNEFGSVFVFNQDVTPSELQIDHNLISPGGIHLAHVDDSRVTGNTILPGAVGIGLNSSERNLVADNVIRGGQSGISTAFYFFNVDNRYERNRVSRSEADGIQLTGTNDVVLGNRVTRSGEDGIDLNGRAPVVGGNTANHNGGWGIRAPTDAIDAGRNRAHANRFPLQCLNVRCH